MSRLKWPRNAILNFRRLLAAAAQIMMSMPNDSVALGIRFAARRLSKSKLTGHRPRGSPHVAFRTKPPANAKTPHVAKLGALRGGSIS